MEIPFRYDPARCALVLVDVQSDFCHPNGSTSKAGQDVSAAVTMLPRLHSHVAAARAASMPVIFGALLTTRATTQSCG
jgi:ureidoacrylate peracid hydrolase